MASNFKYKIARFMYGRYGVDQLYKFTMYLNLVLIVLDIIFSRVRSLYWLSIVLSIIIWVLFFLMIFRFFSRKIEKRRKENETFLKAKQKTKAWFNLTFNRIKFFKTHRFRTCPKCGAVLKLPRKTGKHTVCCPCCKNKIKVHVIF